MYYHDLTEHLASMFNLVHTTAAETLLRNLETDDDIKKQALYRTCRANGPIAYPLKVTLPELASPSLLDRVQNRPDVEGQLRVLKRQRTKERRNAVYIQPQAKANLQAADDTRFPLMDKVCLLYTSPSPRDGLLSRMPSSA